MRGFDGYGVGARRSVPRTLGLRPRGGWPSIGFCALDVFFRTVVVALFVSRRLPRPRPLLGVRGARALLWALVSRLRMLRKVVLRD